IPRTMMMLLRHDAAGRQDQNPNAMDKDSTTQHSTSLRSCAPYCSCRNGLRVAVVKMPWPGRSISSDDSCAHHRLLWFLLPLEHLQIQPELGVKHWHQKQSNERSHTQAADLGVAERTTMERNAGLLLYVFAFERKTRDQK